MANFRESIASRNASLNARRNFIDAGAAGGKIKVYDGAQPANADTALSGNTLLGTLTFSGTCAPDAVSGVLTFSAITEDSAADATGTATFARVTDSDDNVAFDVDVGISGASINLNTVSIVVGGAIRMTSGTLITSAT